MGYLICEMLPMAAVEKRADCWLGAADRQIEDLRLDLRNPRAHAPERSGNREETSGAGASALSGRLRHCVVKDA